MVNNKHIYASAKLLIEQHGSRAEDMAMEKMLFFMQKDDVKGASVWLETMNAINDLSMAKQQKHLH